MKHITLAEDLEKALLRSIIEGISPPSILAAEELSKDGKLVLRSINYLFSNGAKAPISPAVILVTAVSGFGGDRASLRSYLRSFGEIELGSDTLAVAKAARNKELLVSLINEAGEQLSNGSLDIIKLSTLLARNPALKGNKLTPLSDEVTGGFPKPPYGIEIKSLPNLSQATNGLMGIWIIGGEPGLGKTTLAQQIALDISGNIQVIYYDEDGTGKEWFIDRIRQVCGGKIKEFKKATARFNYRESVRSLDSDLLSTQPPAVIVIDSLQTLPTSIAHRRSSLDKWLSDFKQISKRGYTFILISEIGRGAYGEVRLSAFKESGAIEYTGSVCVQLSGDPEDEISPIELHLTKNRHGRTKGHICNLERDTKRVFWFKESESEAEEDI